MAYKYHPEIEGLKVNEDGTQVLYCGELLAIKTVNRKERNSDTKYVTLRGKPFTIGKLVCECWNGLSDNPRWCATRKEKEKGFHYSNLIWAPCGTNPQAKKKKRGSLSKIKESDLPKIKRRLNKGGVKNTLKAIAKDYEVSDMTISRIKKNMECGR